MITLHMVASLDGFIARSDNDVSWLESPADAYPRGANLENVEELLGSIDCYAMGSRTYEHALQLGWPYGDTPVVVLTHRRLTSPRRNVEFCSGDLRELVDRTLAPRFRNIWVVGGAMVCQDFLKRGMVDVLRLSVAPVSLGGGLRLFNDSSPEQRWKLQDLTAYKTGFVETVYSKAP